MGPREQGATSPMPEHRPGERHGGRGEVTARGASPTREAAVSQVQKPRQATLQGPRPHGFRDVLTTVSSESHENTWHWANPNTGTKGRQGTGHQRPPNATAPPRERRRTGGGLWGRGRGHGGDLRPYFRHGKLSPVRKPRTSAAGRPQRPGLSRVDTAAPWPGEDGKGWKVSGAPGTEGAPDGD
jgi:hypothetical protein